MQHSAEGPATNSPPLLRDATGKIDVDSVPDVIDWFVNYDERVAIIRHLHSWIKQLLAALDVASKATEATAETYKLELQGTESIVKQANRVPFERGRNNFLLNCWIETLCTAEARVLGWLYKEFYGRPFQPDQ